MRRLLALIMGWGSVGAVYGLCAFFQGPGYVIQESALDRLVTFNPQGIWLYLSFFGLIPTAYFLTSLSKLPVLKASMQMTAFVCGTIYLVFPTTLLYPPLPTSDGNAIFLLRLLIANDSPQNCLPSLHSALTVLSVWALQDRTRPMRSATFVLLGLGICFSLLQVRRHIGIDLGAGLLVAALSILFYTRLKCRPVLS